MDRTITVSVCLASYNGEKYIRQQIETILIQLNAKDELIVSDDGSSDSTCGIVKELMQQHANIRMLVGPHMGFSCNFGNAIAHAKKDCVIFSDQDDIWEVNKVDTICQTFLEHSEVTTILHNMAIFREESKNDTSEIAITYHSGVIRNFIKSSYWGCCMAIRTEFVRKFVPFRDYCVGHDQLIGLVTEKYGEAFYLEQKLIKHRLHTSNTSNKRTLKQMIVFRKMLFKDFRFAERIFDGKS